MLFRSMTDNDAESVKSGSGGAKANKNNDKVKKGGKSATSGGGTGGANVQAHRNIPIQYPAHRRQLRRVGGEYEDYSSIPSSVGGHHG